MRCSLLQVQNYSSNPNHRALFTVTDSVLLSGGKNGGLGGRSFSHFSWPATDYHLWSMFTWGNLTTRQNQKVQVSEETVFRVHYLRPCRHVSELCCKEWRTSTKRERLTLTHTSHLQIPKFIFLSTLTMQVSQPCPPFCSILQQDRQGYFCTTASVFTTRFFFY